MGRKTLNVYHTENQGLLIEEILVELTGGTPTSVELRDRTDPAFQAAVWRTLQTDRGNFNGEVTLPALNIHKVPLELTNGVLAFGGHVYNPISTIVRANKPIMEVHRVLLVDFGNDGHPDGYLVIATNRVGGEEYAFFRGSSLERLNGGFSRRATLIEEESAAPDPNLETYQPYRDNNGDVYTFEVRGDHDNPETHTATFGGHPATEVDAGTLNFKFSDDLASVEVTRKPNQ